MKVAIGSDHAGLALKQRILAHLSQQGIDLYDAGPAEGESTDYPICAQRVTEAVTAGTCTRGILVCGTGIGMSIAANKVAGIRAALCGDTFSARMTRLHNDANVLCLGERVVGYGLALDIVDLFLTTPFEGGRHQTRIDMMAKLLRE